MSCGNPHDVPCNEVLDLVYWYLDGELDGPDCTKIRQHLDECGPCLRAYGLEEVVKHLVHKYCGYDAVPGQLRAKVMSRIQQVQADLAGTELGADQSLP